MKLSKARLRQIIKEELMAERIATVPQVQQMAAQAGVRLSYGDAKALAARTPAERGALMSLQQAFKNGSWRQIIKEEVEEGLMDTVADKLGYKKKQIPLDKQIEDIYMKVDNYPIDELMDEIHALGIVDEVGEDNSVELGLWHAIQGVYQSFNNLSAVLKTAKQNPPQPRHSNKMKHDTARLTRSSSGRTSSSSQGVAPPEDPLQVY